MSRHGIRRHRRGALLLAMVLSGYVAVVSASAEPVDADQAIRLSQRKLQRNPRDARALYRLGDAYLQKSRESGDVSYLTLAEQALAKSLEIAPGNSGASRHLAWVFYTRHAFDQAAEQAAKAITLDPTDSRAFGILGDAYLEVGKYALAVTAYEKMMQLDHNLDSYSRVAGLKSLRGEVEGAIGDLELAIQDGKLNERSKESVAWVYSQIASEHFAIGDVKKAEANYLEALTTYPHYHRASAGLAHVRVAQRRFAEAIELYQKAIGVIPLPEYAAALGDLYRKLRRDAEAKKQYDLVEYIGKLNRLNDILYGRELAYFYADHDMNLAASLELARRELAVRKDIYGYDVLAWALYKNGKPGEALAAITEALKLGTRDARLFFHAGMIHQKLGNAGRAREYLERTLATNPYFHVLHTDVARRALEELDSPGAR
jgi:tetratricopeptide (TPR) repeat protein